MESSQIEAFIFGQNVEARVSATGWIGEDPDGRDAAFLLMHPQADIARFKMRKIAEALGLRPSREGAMVTVDESVAFATVDGESVVRVYAGDGEVMNRAVGGDWAGVAHDRGFIVMAVGEQGFTPRKLHMMHDIDNYIARGTFHMALLTLR